MTGMRDRECAFSITDKGISTGDSMESTGKQMRLAAVRSAGCFLRREIYRAVYVCWSIGIDSLPPFRSSSFLSSSWY
jgi:hypothetical protein